MGRLAHGLPPRLAAQQSEAASMATSSGGSAADVTPSAAKGASVEPMRAHLCTPDFSGPGHRAWRVTGVAIWPAPHRAKRSAATCGAGQFAKRASFTRSVKETGPAVPGHGYGPPRASAGTAGLAVLREGWQPDRGETLGH